MEDTEIQTVTTRLETPEEMAMREWFADQELASVDNLEAGARQVIQLVTALFGVLFAILALGSDSFEVVVSDPAVIGLGAGATVAFLIALVASLAVVTPQRVGVDPTRPGSQLNAFDALRAYKADALAWALRAFGLGLLLFAGLILFMLWLRYMG